MSSDDDNALKDVDLSAWDVPGPETGAEELADSVIARVGGTDIGAVIPVDAPAGGGRRRALLIAGVAAAVLAVVAGGWAIVKGTRHVAPSSGEVVAQKAQSLELDAARADLDTGADVKWSRRGGVLRVEQTGNVAWRVGTDSKLVVDVGPGQGISTGAALASVEATGASLRVEVTTMNAADAKIAGVVATTAAAVALVTVVVYEGHVKVRDGTTQQTVIVQPGTTYKVLPPPPPLDIVDDQSTDDTPVVGVAPVGPDEPAEVTIVAGDDVIIHDMSPPSRVKIDMTKACRGNADLVVNGVTTPGDTLAFNRGSVKYDVLCDDQAVANGSVTVVRDSLTRPLTATPPVNPITADGRTYRVSFQAMPALEVHGGPGTLHLARGTVEKTYEAKGESVLVPSTDLQAGDYRYWFTPDVMSQLTLSLDTSAPMISLDAITWGRPQIDLEGATLPGATLSIDGISIPVDGRTGRFKALVPAGGIDMFTLRLEHPSAGLHYAIARSSVATTTPPNPVTVTTQSGTLDRGAIMKVMGSLKAKFAKCVQANPPAVHSIIKVKVLVQADGRVGSVDVTQGVQAALDQCVKAIVEGTAFPSASQSTAFLFPIVVEPITTAPANCDADALKDKGMEDINNSEHANALAMFEASLRCKDDLYVRTLAFMAACNAQNAKKAEQYWRSLTPQQQTKYKAMCVRNGIDPTQWTSATPAAPASCDAAAAKDKGMENLNMGQHAAALAQFEASLRCKDDAYVRQLAYMAACNSQNTAKARLYFSKLSATQQTKFLQVCVRNHIDPTGTPSTANDPDATPAPASCDATALKDKGMEDVNMGQHAAALGQFEASLKCKDDAYVRALAFMAACNAQNEPKARFYYAKLPPSQQSKYEQLCVRNHIHVGSSAGSASNAVAPPAHCDADALKEKGMEAVNLGDHAEAFGYFEKSLACKNDSYVLTLAFMAACNAQDAAKSRTYYQKLSGAQKNKYRMMCVRNHIDPDTGARDDADDPYAVDPSTKGYLQITSTPPAKIIIDGVDSGLTTPVTGKKLALAAGKHKVTFRIGDDNFTYPIVIKAGKTETMSKDLR